jgi:hypothetical protein
MGSLKKLLISLLAGMLVTGAFLAAGFLGLFDSFEATFYNARVLERVDLDLEKVNSVFADYQSAVLERTLAMLSSDPFRSSFSVNQTSEDIRGRTEALETLSTDFPAFRSLRILDEQRIQMVFSSRISDIENRLSVGIEYYPVEDLEFSIDMDEAVDLLPDTGRGTWLRRISSEFQLLVYVIPVYNSFDIFSGYAIAEFDTSSLINILTREQLIPMAGEFAFSLRTGWWLIRRSRRMISSRIFRSDGPP